jgi:hypothetical protein
MTLRTQPISSQTLPPQLYVTTKIKAKIGVVHATAMHFGHIKRLD